MTDVLVSAVVATEEIGGGRRSELPIFGGSGAYTALSAAQFAATSLVCAIGSDLQADLVMLARHRFDATHAAIIGAASARFRAQYRNGGDELCVTSVSWGPMGLLRPSVTGVGHVKVLVLGNDDPKYQLGLLAAVKADVVVYGTFGPWLQHRPAESLAIYERADVVVTSKHDVRLLRSVVARSSAQPILVISQGANGVIVQRNDLQEYVDAPDVPTDAVRDVTGAGDALLGALSGALSCTGGAELETVVSAVRASTSVVAHKLRSCGAHQFAQSLESHSRKEVSA